MREVQEQRSSLVVHSIQVSDFALGFALDLALYTDCTEQVIPSRPYKLYRLKWSIPLVFSHLYLWIIKLSSFIWEQGTGRNGFDRILKTWGREGKGRTVFMYLCICLPHSFSKAFYKRIKMTGSPEYSVSLFNPLMKTRPLGSSSTC